MATRAEAKYSLTAVDKSGPAFKSFGRSLKNSARAVGRMAGAALGAGVAGFAVLAKQALSSADRVHKLNQETKASTELLSELRGIASLSGTSLEDVGKAISTMNKNIGGAKTGMKAQVDAFQALGISMQLLDKLDVDQRFELIGASLASLKDASLQAKLGTDIFGRGYKAVLKVFAGGLPAFRQMREEQQKMGRSMSQESAQGAADANDALDTLKQTVSGIVETLTLEFAPTLAEMINTLKGPIVAAVGFAIAAFQRLGKAIGAVMAAYGAVFQGNFREAGSIIASGARDLFAPAAKDKGGDPEVKDLLRSMARDTRRTANAIGTK